jgi:cob(I)alamin adenosyltransferase
VPDDVRTILLGVQNDLFEVGAELSMPEYAGVDTASVAALENKLDRLNDDLPPLREFILPGGDRAAAACHLARTICRRAERRCCELAAAEPVRDDVLRYLNRLSDLLFVVARVLARRDGGSETLWQKRGG